MKFKIILPEQQRDEVELDEITTIVVDVVAFYSNESRPCWALNPKSLHFANFPEDFESLTLTTAYKKDGFQLEVAYEVEDATNGGTFIHDVVLDVTSVEEVNDFPSISN